jgi:GNAT superfamily N-acetyltransferase
MILRTRTEAERRIAEQLESHLKRLPFAQHNHRIQVFIKGLILHISYLTTPSNSRQGQTSFDVTIYQDTCDILDFNIEPSQRRKGYGTIMYQALERFAGQYWCKKMITTPSGDGKEFWPKMGFDHPCEVGLEKRL